MMGPGRSTEKCCTRGSGCLSQVNHIPQSNNLDHGAPLLPTLSIGDLRIGGCKAIVHLASQLGVAVPRPLGTAESREARSRRRTETAVKWLDAGVLDNDGHSRHQQAMTSGLRISGPY